MKKKSAASALISAILILAMFGLSACGPAAPANKPNEPKNDPEPENTVLSSDIYDAFLSGKYPVTADDSCDGLEPGEYLLADFCSTYSEYIEETMVPVNAFDLYYAMIDCGRDDVPELAFRIVMMNGEYPDVTEDFIMKYKDEKLVIIGQYQSYYRLETEINEYGVIRSGGSNGAFTFSYDYSFIDPDGTEKYIYYEDFELGLAQPFVSYFHIPSSIRPADYPYDCFANGNYEDSYTCITYNFTEYDYSADYLDDIDTYNEYMDEYNTNNVYLFEDYEGNIVEPTEYKDLYDNIGLRYYSAEEFEQIKTEYLTELGIDNEIMNADLIEYHDFYDKYTLPY